MNGFAISSHFDKNRFFLVNLGEIEDRLDPYFYRPSIRKFNQYNVQFQRLNVFTKSIRHPPEYERTYSENGYQLLRAQNVRPTGLELENNQVFFSENFLKGKNLVLPEMGDVLVVRSGVNAGDTTVIERKLEKIIIGADNLLIKVNEKIIPKFLQVFFYTDFGKSLMNRYLTGATNKHISPGNLSKIPIPLVEKKTQEKVILIFENVLLQKKQNEAKAEKLLAGIDDYLLKELGITLPPQPENSLKNRMFTSQLRELSGNRFDPLFHYDSIYGGLGKSKFDYKLIKEISTYLKTGFAAGKQDQNIFNKGIIQIRPTNISEKRELIFDKCIYIDESRKKDLIGELLIKNEVLFNNTNSQELVGKTCIFNLDGDYFSSNHITRIGLKDNLNSEYLTSILNLYQKKRVFFKCCINWNNQSGVNVDFLKTLQIPAPPLPKQKEIADHITAIRQQAQQLKDKTKSALEQASKEIEEILLGS